MKKIIRLLGQWENEGFISEEQREKIIQYELNKNSVGKPRLILYAFLALGGAVIGIGIISLIAANWKIIPPYVKLLNNFLILCAAAYGVYRASAANREIYFDGALIFFSSLCLASIGLISQVFHTGGELYEALYLWLILILPVTLLSRGIFPIHLWVVFFVLSTVLWGFSDISFWSNAGGTNKTADIIAFFATLPFFCLLTGIILTAFSRLSERKIPEKFGSAFILWSVISGIVSAIITDGLYSDGSQTTFSMNVVWALILMSAAASLAALLSSMFTRKEAIMVTLLSGLTALIYILPVGGTISDIYRSFIIAGPLYSLTVFLIFAMIFVSRDMIGLFNAITIIIGIRFLIIYFQVIGDLAATGFGLILSGMLIVGLSLLWFKKREALSNFLGGMLK